MNKKAITAEDKRAVIEALFSFWLYEPHLRFGQLLVCSIGTLDLFSLEDDALVRVVSDFVRREEHAQDV